MTRGQMLLWTPRVLGIVVCLFIGMFALDAFSERKPILQAIGDFFIHLIPSFLMLLVLVIAWRREWVGAVAFIGLGVLYMLSVRRLDWILAISGPLFVVGLLFLVSWMYRGTLHNAA